MAIPLRAESDFNGDGVVIDAASLDPNLAALAQLIGLISPAGPDQFQLNLAWFEHPLQNIGAATQQSGAQLAVLLEGLLGQVGGNALGIPAADPARLGTWYPLSGPSDTAGSGLYLTAYPVDPAAPQGAQVFGLGALYEKVLTEPEAIVVEAWGMLPLVSLGNGGFQLVLGSAGFPLSLGLAVESASGPLVDAAGVSFDGVRVTASIELATPPAVTASTVILALQLPGETAPADRSLAQLSNLGGDELLAAASSLAVSALGSVLGDPPALPYLLPVLGLNPTLPESSVTLPLLDWVGMLEIAIAGGNVGRPFVDWFIALASEADLLPAWIGGVAGLFGVSAPVVSGSGTRQAPWSVPLVEIASAGTLSLTLASTVDDSGIRSLFPGLGIAASDVVISGTTVLRMSAAVELAEFDLAASGTAAVGGPSSLFGSAGFALLDSVPGAPLWSGSVAGLSYTFGALQGGVQLSGSLQVVPSFQLVGVTTPTGSYAILDLTQPGELLQVALDELVGDIETELAALLGIAADPNAPFGSQLAALIGLTPPALPDGVTWPVTLAPPLSESQLLATLANPLAALGGYYAALLQTEVGGQTAIVYLVQALGTLLQQSGAGITVSGEGTPASPWRVSLAATGPEVALIAFTEPVAASQLRLTFGLDLAPGWTLGASTEVTLDVRIGVVSFELATATPFSASAPALLPAVSATLALPQGLSTPEIFGASVQVANVGLSVGWSRAAGFGWSMQAGQPALVVGTTTMPVGKSLDFSDPASLAELVTAEAATFGPILTGLLGIAVCRTGSPAGIAVTGLFGLLPDLTPFLPPGLSWPPGMPVLQLTGFDDPATVLKTQVAGLFANPTNAGAAITLFGWALGGGVAVPPLVGSGTYADPFQVSLGFSNAVGLRVWYDPNAPMVGLGLGRDVVTSLPLSVSVDTRARLDMIEIALGSSPLTGGNPVPSLTLEADFTLPSVPGGGGATLSEFRVGILFTFDGGELGVAPLFDLTVSMAGVATVFTLADFLANVDAGDTQLQQVFLGLLNAAVQAVVGAAGNDPTFNEVYSLLAELGLVLQPTPANGGAPGIDPAGFQGLIADPLGYLAREALALVATPAGSAQLFALLERLLGITPPAIPTPVLDVLAAMGYVAPADLGYAPLPGALVALARNPVATVAGRFEALVSSPQALATLVGQLQIDLDATTFGPFTATVTGGRFVALSLTDSVALGSLFKLGAQLQFDLQELTLTGEVSFFLPGVGVAVVAEVAYAFEGASSPIEWVVSLAWGDGSQPAPEPLQIYPFEAPDFIAALAAVAPAQALSTFVTQVFDAYVLAPSRLAQIAFSSLGIAFQDDAGAWHLKSLLGLFDDPVGWLLSGAVLGVDGQLNLSQLATVLGEIPNATTSSGISVSQIGDGIRIGGLPYNLQIDLTVDLPAGAFRLASNLSTPLTLANGDASVQALSLGLSFGTNLQAGFTGSVAVAGLAAPNTVVATFGYDGGFSLSVGANGGASLVLLPFDGWTALLTSVARLAIQELLQELTTTLLTGLAQSGDPQLVDLVQRLQTAAPRLDVSGLITTLSSLTDPAAFLDALLDWVIARFAPANVDDTMLAVSGLFSGLVTGISATNGLLSYQPPGGFPLIVQAGSVGSGADQQLGLWVSMAEQPISLLSVGVDLTGVAFAVADPGTPIFTFGLHLSVPITGQTGPELDLVFDSASQGFQLTFDPQGGDSPLERELYPQLFGPGGPTPSAVEAWLLAILLQVLPRYVSIVVLNSTTVKGWLDAPLVAGGPEPGAVLVGSELLVQSASGVYALNSFSALSALSPLRFLGGFLRSLLATSVKVLSLGPGGSGGVFLEPNPLVADSFGVRVTVADLAIPALPNFVLQVGASDATWIANAGGTPPAAPGISVYLPIDSVTFVPSFGDLEINLVNVGLDIVGVQQNPLVNLPRFALGGVSPRLLLALSFQNGTPAVTFGAAVTLDEIAISVAPNTLTSSANPIAQNLLGSGGSTSPTSSTTNPSFSALAAYVTQLFVNLIAPDGSSGKTILIPVQRSFGPLQVNDIGFEWNDSVPTDPILGLEFDGGVALAGLSAQVQGLVVGIPVLTPADFAAYTLDLAGLAVSFSGGGVKVAGGLLKQDSPLQYDGIALISFGSKFALTALGSYALVPVSSQPGAENVPSLFVFVVLDATLGGPPVFFVTGLAGGFSYNRGLTLPQPAAVQSYPLVQGAMQPSSFFGPSPTPTSALTKLSDVVFPSVGQSWVAAGVKFTSFELISSFAMISILFGRSFEISLVGASVMTMPPLVPESEALAYIEMGLVASFNPEAGTVSVFAQLTPNSFVLSPDARLTGGFAFALWFAGAQAGDFVVTFGGYHPAFVPPSDYPVVPRLGLNWPISSSPQIAVNGDAYFALTPSAVMAGTHLSLVFEAGPLSAWLKAAADFILSWKPFFFEASIAVSVGVSFQTTVLGVSVTLRVALGCQLQISGPPTGGLVEVDWYVISFTIPFGEQDVQPDAPFASWADFAQAFLPKPSDAPNTLALTQSPTPPDPSQQVLKVTAAAGLLGVDPDAGWLIQPFGFTLRVDTAVPATQTTVADTVLDPGPAIGVRPMNLDGIDTPLTLAVLWAATKEPVVLPSSTAKLAQVLSGSPEALWAQSPLDINAPPTSAFIANAVLGATITGDQVQLENPIPALTDPPISLSALAFESLGALLLPFAAPAFSPAPQLPQGDNFEVLMTTVTSDPVAAYRNAVFAALRTCDIAAPVDVDLSILASAATSIYLAPPVLAQLGFDLETSSFEVRSVRRVLPPRPEVPSPAPLAAPRPLGRAVRYRLAQAVPSWNDLLLPWSGRSVVRWIDVEDGPEAWNSLGAIASADGTLEPSDRTIAIAEGATELFEVDPAGRNFLESRGPASLHLAAFDRNHRRLAVQILGPRSILALPAGTHSLCVTALAAGQPPIVGWQEDSRLLRLNDGYLLGDLFLIRPQGGSRLGPIGRRRRRGLLDGLDLLAGNRVSDHRRQILPGWVETFLPGGAERLAVLVAPRHNLVVSAAPAEGAGAGAVSRPLPVRRRFGRPGGEIHLFDPPAVAEGELLRVRVQPSGFHQLRGVFALYGPAAENTETWPAAALVPPGPEPRRGSGEGGHFILSTRPAPSTDREASCAA